MEKDNENIQIILNEVNEEIVSSIDLNEFLKELNDTNTNSEWDSNLPQMIHYNENFTVKELLLICEYYGFAKEMKNNKYNKEQIINILVSFESDEINNEIVFKRQNMWFYINELKNDKFMKKYILW
jgi:hypothetical protein